MLYGCTKAEPTRTSGIDTIDNIIYSPNDPYVYGFSFSAAKLISTKSDPGPDIVLFVSKENNISRLTLQANNLKPSFYKAGDYQDEQTAISAFKDLKTIDVPQWQEMADPVAVNQVWIYRTGRDKYTKFRVVSTKNEIRDLISYGECTFEWLYQADGSLTFSGK